ncbi:sensor histidine kinase [Cellulomonas soli]|uniref:histidine kinase n=1 Tax=Cellulomonas soli TaxID=931535 RepID=A0A512PGW1_9CELL|nr:histidine kinase [Cellulomonas soli]NYI59631.1 signal transduction histidine kinase [Cellulomonas soli]GEP70425.1 two-component sensor histidine kinase [Cellulomonas soli]
MILGRPVVERLRRRPSLVDAVLGLALGAAFLLVPLAVAARLRHKGGMDLDLTAVDIALTVVCALALTQVRRLPLVALVVTSVANLVAMIGGWQVNLAQFGVTLAMFGYALHEPRTRAVRAAAITSVLLGITSVLSAGLRTGEWGRIDVVLWLWTATAVALAIASRRATMVALTDRALRAEETREETARRRVAEDRVRIARELHDVIAHHVAVISVQSGVAEHLIDRDPAGAREALHHVRGSARSVLAELQSVLGVLRQDETALPTAPAPGLADLAGLVATARALGTPVRVEASGPTPTLSPAAGSAAYRLVQEALTNVQKHATGAPTTVRVETSGDHLLLTVTNVAPPRTSPARAADPPHEPIGSGLGLVGMRERVLAAGGTLEVGPTPDSGFRVAALLPLTVEDR